MKHPIFNPTRRFVPAALVLALLLFGVIRLGADKKLPGKVDLGSKEPPLVVDDAVNRLSDAVARVAQRASPCVVSVHTEKVMAVQPFQYFNPFEEFFGDSFGFGPSPHGQQPGRKKAPREFRQQGLGSGVIVSREGYVLTDYHVVGGMDEIEVTLADERSFPAEIVGGDEPSDVALIRIKDPPKDLPVALLGQSENLRIGEFVVAIGSPFGYSNTVTLGIVSAKGRQAHLNLFENFIQTDAAINPGNSGGALLNLRGEVVGINAAIASESGGSQGVGFAIPIDMARRIMEDLLAGGKVHRGFLGVHLQDVDDNLREALKLQEKTGALVIKVMEDSPAAKAGLEARDVILEVDGKKVKDTNHLRNAVAQLNPGKSYDFTVLRDGERRIMKVQVGEREQEGEPSGMAEKPEKGEKIASGLEIEALREEHMRAYNLTVREGVVVTGVAPGSLAMRAGFRAGDVILEAGGVRIKTPRDFKAVLKKADQRLLILVDRRGAQLFLALKLE